MHLNWMMPLGGSLRGTLPNPDFSANGLIETQVFGPRSSGSSYLPLSEEETVQVVELARTFSPTPYSNPHYVAGDFYVSGSATLGDASGDTITVSAATWTLPPTGFTATTSAGALAAGVTFLNTITSTATGDAGGTTNLIAYDWNAQFNGGNATAALQTILCDATHNASALLGSCLALSGRIVVNSSGNITTAADFSTNAPVFNSTGVITTKIGYRCVNQGNATKVTNAIGFDANTFTPSITLTASFRSQQNSGTGAWGFYHSGTANNAFNGNVRIGSTTAPTVALDVTGQGKFSASLAAIGGITTSGTLGAPAIVATGRSTAQTAAVASVSTFTVGASDGSFEVSANVLVTTATAHNFTVTCAYTDETNTARTLTFGFTQLTGSTFITAITNLTGTGPYESPVFHLRCKASTAITIATTGTFTTVTYNVEGIIKQIA